MPERPALPAPSGAGLRPDSAAPSRKWVRAVAFLILGMGVFSCLACGTLLYVIRPRVIDDPAIAAEVSQSILTFTPPSDFKPKGVIDWDIYGLLSLRGVYFETDALDVLILLEVGTSRLQGYTDVERHIERTLREKNGISDSLVVNTTSEKRLYEIQGRNREFLFTEAQDPATQTRYMLVEGTVAGRSGPVLIGMRIATSSRAWNLDAIQAMLESIQ